MTLEQELKQAEILGKVMDVLMTPKRERPMHKTETLSLHEMHDEIMASTGECPDKPDCPFCAADRAAERREHGDYSGDSPMTPEDRANWFSDYHTR